MDVPLLDDYLIFLRNTLGVRMDCHAVTGRLKHLPATAGIPDAEMHPRMFRLAMPWCSARAGHAAGLAVHH
ncbi:MAG TPA: hypothetical protein VFM54_00380 [Micromonosporaceae bacterium]|nr:hypothetical protein [Micromonosporaceae bacterium]